MGLTLVTWLVGDWFMGLRGVQGIWRWAVALWLVLVGGLVGAAFWLSAG